MGRISPRKFAFAGTFLSGRIVCAFALLFLSCGAVRADQTRLFLTDRSRHRFESEAETLYVSPIFDWYEDDFANADGIGALSDYFAKNANLLTDDASARRRLSMGDVRIRYTDYVWRLNSRERSTP